jgi:hypothetical protein
VRALKGDAVPYRTIMLHTTPHTAPNHTKLHNAIIYNSTALHCTVLHYTKLHYTILHRAVPELWKDGSDDILPQDRMVVFPKQKKQSSYISEIQRNI